MFKFYQLYSVNLFNTKELLHRKPGEIKFDRTDLVLINEAHIIEVSLTAAFIQISTTVDKVSRNKTYPTFLNIDFVKNIVSENFLSKEFFDLVEEHRKLFTGDETTDLEFGDDCFDIRWKKRPNTSGI